MNLIIVRHALPERADGDHATADPPLSEAGRRQAEATADFLAGERIDHLAASPLQRARQTAQPLADRLGLELETVEGLREIDPFGGAYVPAEELTLEHKVVQDFVEDRYSLFENEGGFQHFRSRVVDAFDALVAAHRGQTVAVFCHGTVVGVYLTALLGLDDPFLVLPDYCGLCRVAASANGWRTVRSVNETAHVRASRGSDGSSGSGRMRP